MGIWIHLDILPWEIEPEAWRVAWDESLRLLRAHPSRLVGLRAILDEDDEVRRLVYSQDLEQQTGRPSHHWHVVGDKRSGQTGESFLLHRELAYYRNRMSRPRTRSPDPDVALEVHRRECERNAIPVAAAFDSKTQGRPYHEALVAVVCLLEERFGRAAFGHGDIDVGEARRASEWASRVLGRKIPLPACVRPAALLARLTNHLDGEALLDTCKALNRAPREELLRAFARTGDRPTLESWVARNMKEDMRGESPDARSAIPWFAAWLNATRDFDALVSIVCVHEAGPRFSPRDFASAAVNARNRRAVDADRDGELFGLLGLPVRVPRIDSSSKLWPAPRTLVRRIGARFPAERERIEQAVATAVAGEKVSPGDWRRTVRELKRRMHAGPPAPRILERDPLPTDQDGLLLRGLAVAARKAAEEWSSGPGRDAKLRGDADALREVFRATLGQRPLFEETWAALPREREEALAASRGERREARPRRRRVTRTWPTLPVGGPG